MSVDDRNVPNWLSVSRETLERLHAFLNMVERWNPRINLVSSGSLAEGWTRHILDSAQLWWAAGVTSGLWLDIGSGGGFPGLVIAILAREHAPGLEVCLVESDQRKCVFLNEAARTLGLKVTIRNARIETLEPAAATVVSARAMAPLSDLLSHAHRHLAPEGIALLPKGQNFAAELDGARQKWLFESNVIPSETDARAVILKIGRIQHA